MDERLLRGVLADRPSDVQAWCDAARFAKGAGCLAVSLTAYDRALALRPGDAAIAGARRGVTSSVVPRWHFPMLNDGPRNDAYAAAIQRAVLPEHHVLEIGTGSGLLAMLSARSGARHVTTCEMVPLIAETARRVIAKNGLSDRIQVVTGRSQDLEVGREISEAGDVLVSEIISNDFLSEGVLDSVADARARLLNADAIVIPASASIRGALVGGEQLMPLLSAGSYRGLDLRSFDVLGPAVLPISEAILINRLSDPVDLFRFDFTHGSEPRPERRSLIFQATAAGRCFGVVQWIRLDLDAETTFENTPFADTRSHWEPVLHAFPRSIDVKPEDLIHVVAMHDVASIMIALESVLTT